jgi:transketolase
MLKAVGAIDDAELLTFRKFGSRLEGHPTPALPWVDVATGSLGQGLPIGVGVALAGKNLDRLPFHVWVLCGDSEIAEGSIWEALDKAGRYGLTNLTPIVDVNRLGQRGETEYGWRVDVYAARVAAFGCTPVVIDGHDVAEIDRALGEARESRGRPTVILARTVKGKGFSEIEDKEGWHGKALPPDMAERALKELGGERNLRVETTSPEPGEPYQLRQPSHPVRLPEYAKGEKVATRKAYGDALLALGALASVVATDGEVSNSTHADEFAKAYPERFFEMWIAEQQLVATAVGLAVRGYAPFASTFAAFFSRAYDFIRMAGVSEVSIKLAGSHAGVEIGQDGPSQMALEDLAAMRAVHSSTVLYPSDAVSAAALTETMVSLPGVAYMRTTRGAYPVLYDAGERFPIGGSKVVKRSTADQVALIGAGVTLHNCLEAAGVLAKEGIKARVIDLYSVKPIDVETLREASADTGGRLVVAEDHYPQGGLAAAVMEALAMEARPPRVAHCAVRNLPTSGAPTELLAAERIDAAHIAEAARGLVAGPGKKGG